MIYACPADLFGCGSYRLVFPAKALANQGHDVTVLPPGQSGGVKGWMHRGQLHTVWAPDDCEVLVVQRPANRYMVDAIRLLRQRGVAVVVDMDDDLSRIHPGNAAFDVFHPARDSNLNWRHVEAACREATMVTVSTEKLAPIYGAHGRVAVLPNCVPERYLDVGRDDCDGVGWAGSTHSHPDDLQAVGNALARIGGPFLQVGPAEGVRRALGLREEPESTGLVGFDEWPEAVARICVGIAPLADSVFNLSKSWLKILEYSALGVPWVASDRVEYRRLHERGCGLLAKKPREWERALRLLIGSSEARADHSGRGREVARSLTVEGNAWRWMQAWSDALIIQRGGRVGADIPRG